MEIFCNPLNYASFKDTLIRFIASTSAQIESITLCHFNGDIVSGVCNVLGQALRHFDAHLDSRPLRQLMTSVNLNRALLQLWNMGVIMAIASKYQRLEYLGIDIGWLDILLLRPGGYNFPFLPPDIGTPPLGDFSRIPPPPLPNRSEISSASPPPPPISSLPIPARDVYPFHPLPQCLRRGS